MPTLIPHERRFYKLFDDQASNVVAAATELLSLFNDVPHIQEHTTRIKDLEHAGDDLTHEMVRTLNRVFVTPFDREDIYALGSGLDDLLDFIDEIAETISLYGITEIPPHAHEMASLLAKAAEQLKDGISRLESRKGLEEHRVEVHRLENLGDAASRRAIGDLFHGGYDTLTVIKLKEFYSLLEDSLDRCEDLANIIENIIIKNA